MKINILGTEYLIRQVTETEYPKLTILEANGLFEAYSKEIIIDKNIDDGSGKAYANIEAYERKVLRHEIIHAFFHESGLQDRCEDEALIDWLAFQIPKIAKLLDEINCLD
jgi:hypothetical protein